jgi:DNA-binding NarL/FixJ family response regulator
MTTCPRVLLVEDDTRTSEAVHAILSAAGFTGIEVTGSARGAETRVRSLAPDVILVDLGLPDGDGVELIRALRASAFAGPILVLTSARGPDRILAALRGGADGYLFKDDLDAKLSRALGELARGGSPLSPGAAKVLVHDLRQRPPSPRNDVALPALTARERAILELLSTGASYAEMGRELAIRLNTVRTHIRSLYHKLGVQNRAEAVNLAWNMGLLRRAW